MSMSELYALATVANLAFKRVWAEQQKLSTPSSLSKKCKDAIGLVASSSRLIADIWWLPEEKKHGIFALKRFHHDKGRSRIEHIQNSVTQHIANINDVCSMCDTDTLAMSDPSSSLQRVDHLSKLHKECLTAIKTIDKPNVHRLVEFAYTTLPMVRHSSVVGELVLERTHQTLKRALRQSNRKEFQIMAMRSIAFDDWQGRLTLAVSGVYKNCELSLLSCFRLLWGRDSVSTVNAMLSTEQKSQVLESIGPEACVPVELRTQAKSVLSPRYSGYDTLVCSLRGRVQNMGTDASSWRGIEVRVRQFIMNAFRPNRNLCTVSLADQIVSYYPNGVLECSFHTGDILEVLCCRPHDPSFHFPFVVQPNCSDHLGSLRNSSGLALWFVTAAIFLEYASRNSFYIAVRPCLAVYGPLSQDESEQCLKRYKVDSQGRIPFAAMDRSMREVGAVRDCTCISCNHTDSSVAETADRPCQGLSSGAFTALTRQEGFPPRQG